MRTISKHDQTSNVAHIIHMKNIVPKIEHKRSTHYTHPNNQPTNQFV